MSFGTVVFSEFEWFIWVTGTTFGRAVDTRRIIYFASLRHSRRHRASSTRSTAAGINVIETRLQFYTALSRSTTSTLVPISPSRRSKCRHSPVETCFIYVSAVFVTFLFSNGQCNSSISPKPTRLHPDFFSSVHRFARSRHLFPARGAHNDASLSRDFQEKYSRLKSSCDDRSRVDVQ